MSPGVMQDMLPPVLEGAYDLGTLPSLPGTISQFNLLESSGPGTQYGVAEAITTNTLAVLQ